MMLHSGSGPESESESESEPQSQLQFQFPNRAQVPFVGHISFVSRYRHISIAIVRLGSLVFGSVFWLGWFV